MISTLNVKLKGDEFLYWYDGVALVYISIDTLMQNNKKGWIIVCFTAYEDGFIGNDLSIWTRVKTSTRP